MGVVGPAGWFAKNHHGWQNVSTLSHYHPSILSRFYESKVSKTKKPLVNIFRKGSCTEELNNKLREC
jgi:hypothetical protein